jgi:hypothetical protein
MRRRASMATLAEYGFRRLGHPPYRSHPRASRAATFTAEKRTHVRQDGVGNVEYHLKWSESEYADGETPGEPLGVGQVPQDLRNGFPSELHRAIRHQEVVLISPDLVCADFCTQCAMRRQTPHSSLNKRIGLVCFCICKIGLTS